MLRVENDAIAHRLRPGDNDFTIAKPVKD